MRARAARSSESRLHDHSIALASVAAGSPRAASSGRARRAPRRGARRALPRRAGACARPRARSRAGCPRGRRTIDVDGRWDRRDRAAGVARPLHEELHRVRRFDGLGVVALRGAGKGRELDDDLALDREPLARRHDAPTSSRRLVDTSARRRARRTRAARSCRARGAWAPNVGEHVAQRARGRSSSARRARARIGGARARRSAKPSFGRDARADRRTTRRRRRRAPEPALDAGRGAVRVLPMPGGPVTVTIRAPPSSSFAMRSRTSARPTSGTSEARCRRRATRAFGTSSRTFPGLEGTAVTKRRLSPRVPPRGAPKL